MSHSVFASGQTSCSQLDWRYHIDFVLSKISKYVGIFYKLSHYIPKSVLLLLYNSLIYPHLIYAIEIWGNTTKTLLNPILLLQKKLIRIISGAEYLAHSAPLFYSLKVLDIYKVYSLHMKLLAFQMNKSDKFKISSVELKQISSVHQHYTRSACNQNLYFKTFKKTANKSFTARVSNVWNEFPPEIKALSCNKFYVVKSIVKNTLLTQYI